MDGNTPQGPAPFPPEPQRPNFQPGGMNSNQPQPGMAPGPMPVPPQPQPQFNPRPPQPPMMPSGGVVPPPPPPEIGMRTMASDASSMRQSGGMQPQPKTFRPEDLAGAPTFQSQPAVAPAPRPAEPPAPNKFLVVLGGVIVVLIIAGVVFLLFLKPIFLGTGGQNLGTAQLPATTTGTSSPTDLTATSTIGAEIPAFSHKSFFVTAPALSVISVLDKPTLASLTTSVQALTASSEAAGSLKELMLAGPNFMTSDLLTLMLPDVDATTTADNLRRDFTSFVYYDKDGVWPGYVFELKETAATSTKATLSADVEKSKNLANFYLTTPGAAKASVFKDGAPIKNNTVRYLSYTKAGSSFNYAWLGNDLVISTSFNGFKEAAKLMGF